VEERIDGDEVIGDIGLWELMREGTLLSLLKKRRVSMSSNFASTNFQSLSAQILSAICVIRNVLGHQSDT
jgi:hypothetical protein